MLSAYQNALPKLIRFMINHFVNGLVLVSACALLAIQVDVGEIGTLLSNYDNALLTGLVIFYSGMLFGIFHLSVAVMNLGDGG